jgi:hypothetical protein
MLILVKDLAEQWLSQFTPDEISELNPEELPENWSVARWEKNFKSEVDVFYVNHVDYEELPRRILPIELIEAIDQSAANRKYDWDDVAVVFPRNYKPSTPLPDTDEYRWLSPVQYWQTAYTKPEDRKYNPPANSGYDHL